MRDPKDRPSNSPTKKQKRTYYISIPDYIKWHPKLTEKDKDAYWVIKSYDNGPEHCFAKLNVLAAAVESTPGSLQKSITKLTKMKIVDNLSKIHKTRCLAIHPGLEERLHWVVLAHEDKIIFANWDNKQKGLDKWKDKHRLNKK